MENLLCVKAALINGDVNTAIQIYAEGVEPNPQTRKRTRKSHDPASRGFGANFLSSGEKVSPNKPIKVSEDSLTDFFKHYGY